MKIHSVHISRIYGNRTRRLIELITGDLFNYTNFVYLIINALYHKYLGIEEQLQYIKEICLCSLFEIALMAAAYIR